MNKYLLLLLAIMVHSTALADGGAVQLQREIGDLMITVFASPPSLVAGRADLSVLVQKRNGLEPVLDADVFLSLREPSTGAEFEAHATREKARNKLLYESPVMFSRPGKWQIAVTIQRNGQLAGVGGNLDVAPAPSRAVSYAGYIAFPPVMIVLFAVRERLLRRRLQR